MSRSERKVSKFLSYVLRHKPEAIGLSLDPNGWAPVDDLILLAEQDGFALDRAIIEQVVAKSDKQRFTLSIDGQRIRANQGHSIAIDLELTPRRPPELLYHGTAQRFLMSIELSGLERRGRHHVHLSADPTTALTVGGRHGRPIVLVVKAREMHGAGHVFFCSDNGVWLTDHVPQPFIIFSEAHGCVGAEGGAAEEAE